MPTTMSYTHKYTTHTNTQTYIEELRLLLQDLLKVKGLDAQDLIKIHVTLDSLNDLTPSVDGLPVR